jgi:co-chaperonin GroES (HSP10)
MMEVKNESGLRPLGRAILLEHYEPERKESMIVIPENVKDRTVLLEQRATVVELGSHCYPDEPQRCYPGDRVLISRMAGYVCHGPADGKRYVMVNDRDVFAQIVKEKENE